METTDIKQIVNQLVVLFDTMSENYNTFGALWKNIDLAKQAFTLMKSLPTIVEDAFDSPIEKAMVLGNMLENMEETLSPRFCIKVREYMLKLNPDDDSNYQSILQLRDYINLNLPMEDYCRKYHKHLKFDNIERTQQWEDIIVKVEEECSTLLGDNKQGMGYCHMYWSTKRSILAKHGIEWRSPSAMNPRVMFD